MPTGNGNCQHSRTFVGPLAAYRNRANEGYGGDSCSRTAGLRYRQAMDYLD
jgi:hypothetical protein